MKQIFAISQQKGGVGKTTTTINLGAALAQRGSRVLLIDLDPQGSLSIGLGVEPRNLEQTVYEVLLSSKLSLESVLIETRSGCYLAPANIDLAAAEMQLVSEPGRETILKEKLVPLQDKFDYVLIDCPPSLGLLPLNALAAATGVIIPVQTQYLALRGMDLLLQTIEKVQARINPELQICGILPTLLDSRTTHSREVLDLLQTTYKERVFESVIPDTVKFQDASIAGDSILQFAPSSDGAQAYLDLAKEVESHG